jgi:hypothetical protein
MLSATEAKDFATRYLEAANSHNADNIVSFYAEDGELVSPVVAKLMSEPSGNIKGRAALREYFGRFVSKYSYMSLQLVEAACGLSSIVIWFVNQKGSRTSMYLELDPSGKIQRTVLHYND